jgi:hypothetical protein
LRKRIIGDNSHPNLWRIPLPTPPIKPIRSTSLLPA